MNRPRRGSGDQTGPGSPTTSPRRSRIAPLAIALVAVIAGGTLAGCGDEPGACSPDRPAVDFGQVVAPGFGETKLTRPVIIRNSGKTDILGQLSLRSDSTGHGESPFALDPPTTPRQFSIRPGDTFTVHVLATLVRQSPGTFLDTLDLGPACGAVPLMVQVGEFTGIANGDFEAGSAGWTSTGAQPPAVQATGGNPDGCAQWSCGFTGECYDGCLEQDFVCGSGLPGDSCGVSVDCYDRPDYLCKVVSPDLKIRIDDTEYRPSHPSNQWRTFSVRIPSGSHRLALCVQTGWYCGHAFRFDNVTVQAVPVPLRLRRIQARHH
jgi:hypothetical protein